MKKKRENKMKRFEYDRMGECKKKENNNKRKSEKKTQKMAK